jgi:hypothetical protein
VEKGKLAELGRGRENEQGCGHKFQRVKAGSCISDKLSYLACMAAMPQ